MLVYRVWAWILWFYIFLAMKLCIKFGFIFFDLWSSHECVQARLNVTSHDVGVDSANDVTNCLYSHSRYFFDVIFVALLTFDNRLSDYISEIYYCIRCRFIILDSDVSFI